jgi:hypothetical protein
MYPFGYCNKTPLAPRACLPECWHLYANVALCERLGCKWLQANIAHSVVRQRHSPITVSSSPRPFTFVAALTFPKRVESRGRLWIELVCLGRYEVSKQNITLCETDANQVRPTPKLSPLTLISGFRAPKRVSIAGTFPCRDSSSLLDHSKRRRRIAWCLDCSARMPDISSSS